MTIGELRNSIVGLPPDKEVRILSHASLTEHAYTVRLTGIRAADSLKKGGDIWLIPGIIREVIDEEI